MIVKLYRNAHNVGWLGWIENSRGIAVGFIQMNGEVTFNW